jgi:hypothetical protein
MTGKILKPPMIKKFCLFSRMPTTGPTVEVRGHSTGVRLQVWQKKHQQKTLSLGLLIKEGTSHKSSTAAQFVSLLSQITTKCLVVPIKGYTKQSAYTWGSKQHDRCNTHQNRQVRVLSLKCSPDFTFHWYTYLILTPPTSFWNHNPWHMRHKH